MTKKEARFFAHAAAYNLINSYISSEFYLNETIGQPQIISDKDRRRIEIEIYKLMDKIAKSVKHDDLAFTGTRDILEYMKNLK